MQLKRLEAYGFKSFAEKTEIVFHRGITAIVGPNGSGKSNITDAIRWVLGEQNTRNLRAAKAEDIIFSGSSARKALNVAEVSLVFDNSDGTLPIAYQEVVVTRRLFRSGESESYINHARCRIKDVYQLFADTGIGHEGMSIIGQNSMDHILNSRPEERRAFFEETAGITKYKTRKGEALRKMESTEKNLVRVQDIMQEIDAQLVPLAKQAEKTRLFDKLSGEYRQCEISSLSEKYDDLTAARTEKQEKKGAVRDKQAALAASIKEKETACEKTKLQIVKKEASLQKYARQEQDLQEKVEYLQAELAVRRERQSSEDAARTRLTEQAAETKEELQATKQAAQRISESLAGQAHDMSLLQDNLKEKKEEFTLTESALRDAEDALAVALAQEEEQRAHSLTCSKELAVMKTAVEFHAQGQCEQGKKQQDQETRIADAKRKTEHLQEQLTQSEQEATQFENKLQLAITVSRERKEALFKARRQHQDLCVQLKELMSRRKLLERMQQAYEGFGMAVRSVLRNEEPWHEGICGAVAELLEVPGKYVTAIEVALAGSQQHVVIEDTETAKAAIAFLKRRRLGRVTFLPLTSLVVRQPADASSLLAKKGVLGFASNLIRIEEKYRRVAEFLLGRTLVVDTLDHALAIANDTGRRQRIVTLEGELLHPGGSISGGGRFHRDASFLGRRSELAFCCKQIEDLQDREKKVRTHLEEQEALCQTAEQSQAHLVEAQQAHLVHQAELKTALTTEQAALQEEERSYRESAEQYALLQQSFAKAQETLSLQKSRVRQAEEKLAAHAKETEEKREEAADISEDVDALKQQIFAYEKQLAVLSATCEQDTVRLQDVKRRIKQKQQVLEKIQRELARLQDGDKENQASIDKLTMQQECLREERKQLRQKKDDCYAEKMRLLEEAQSADQVLKKLASRQREHQEMEHQLDLQLSKIDYALEDCTQKLLSMYGLTPELAAAQRLQLPAAEVKTRLQELKGKIETLGPVNPEAIKEYEEQCKRLDFMQRQAQDLDAAKADLSALMQEMDDVMTKQFQSAFTKIQGYFQQSFVKLFGGGQAELKLLDDGEDILHAGIDILVTLPHKKRQGLSALSGGERALTVIALLFAFLTYKPSPFSVLDEIDAPLDEANVARFGQYLRELSHATQFIVVTHRKGTMESADTMYGVTTDGAGVSQVLSVKLDEV